MDWRYVTVVGCAAILAGCQAPTAPGSSAAATAAAGGAVGLDTAVEINVTGGGRYSLLNTFDTQFAFSAVAAGDGRASGRFHQSLLFQGLLVEFHGEVTCVTVDSANRRAWVGGVITQNNSAHPSFQAPRNQPGRDIWFRVLDVGPGGSGGPDRTTFTGFEGDADIETSAEYCAVQPWPDDNARTWPVTSGNITVRP